MACTDGISKAIVSNCSTQRGGGLEVNAWLFNRKNITPTFDVTNPSKVSSIANAVGEQGYLLTGVKSLLNAGHDIVTAIDRANLYTHYFSFQQFEIATEDIENVTAMDDIVAIVEIKNDGTEDDGVFKIYGLKNGLHKSTDTQRANDINGARNVECTSVENSEENVPYHVLDAGDYATTVALLATLLTPGT